MKTKFNGFLTLFLALFVQITFAQEKTISGVVSDSTGPLPGVSVLKKGTVQGTETDFDGKYVIKAKTGDTLVFSFVGMETVEKVVGSSNNMSVTLKDGDVLDEVVVVGYTSTTKESFTGSAKVVEAANITAKSVSNVAQALAGESAGVNVVRASGQPGSSAKIRIRGFGSVNGSSDPLYVVDGVPFTGEINSINPEDVASTTILKDATATAIYGSRGANGVIVITTKNGTAGKTTVEVDFKTTLNTRLLPRYNMVLNQEKYMELSYLALKNSAEALGSADPSATAASQLFSTDGISTPYNMWNASGEDLIDPATGKFRAGITRKYTPTSWESYAVQPSFRKDMNLKISGGTDKAKHYLSLGYLNDVGYVRNSDYTRYSLRANLALKPTTWLKTNANINYTFGTTNDGTGGGAANVNYVIDNMPTIYPLFIRDENGNIVNDPYFGKPAFDYGDQGRKRPASPLTNGVADSFYDISRTNEHIVNGRLNIIASLAEGLSFESTYGLMARSGVYSSVGNPYFGADSGENGTLYQSNTTTVIQNFNQMLRYKTVFNDNHNVEAFIAHESNEVKLDYSNLNKKGVVNLAEHAATSASNYVAQRDDSEGYIDRRSLESYFGQLNYNFDNKYYVSGTVRRDGSSRFLNNKWGTFWSTGFAWAVHNEGFMSDLETVNFLKLKVSYGVLGDERGVSYYGGQNGFDVKNLDGKPSLVIRPVVDPNITWETSNQFQTGIEFELFDGLVESSIDYYSKHTTNLMFNKRLAPSLGDAIMKVNDGELLNSGVEFDVTGHVIKNDNYSLSLSLNGEVLNNELLKMPYDESIKRTKIINTDGNFGQAEGRSLYDYYLPVWSGVDPANGNALWVSKWHDKNENGSFDSEEEIIDLETFLYKNPKAKINERLTSVYNEATKQFVGKSAIPKVRGAFRLNAGLGNFNFSTQFAYSFGGYGYDNSYARLMANGKVGSGNYHKDIYKSWKKPGDITNVPRFYNNLRINDDASSTRFLISSDYVALNNVRLGYDVPSTYMENSGLSSVSLWMSADNLLMLSARNGFNPSLSLSGASDSYTYAPISSFTIGARIKF